MKKLISILLVAMLIIGMFPATALTAFAATEIEFALGANGSASHYDGQSAKTTYSETVGNYTLSITGGTNMYPGARDAKGNSCIKLGTSKKIGSFSFTVPSDVTKVVVEVAKYKANNSTVAIAGVNKTLTKASNNGEYDVIEVDTTSTKTISVATVGSTYRAMVNTITFVIGADTEPEQCDHELVQKTARVEPTCTKPGTEAYFECACGVTTQGGGEISALGHAMANGVCSRCGLYENTLELMTAIPSNSDKVVIYSSNHAMGATDNGYGKLQAIATAPEENKLPYYTSVAVLTVGTVEGYYTFANAQGEYLTTVEKGGALSFETNLTDLAKWTIEAAATNTWYIINKAATYNGTDFNQVIEYFGDAFTTYGKRDEAAYQMAFYLVEKGDQACLHTNAYETNDGYKAECGVPGKTNSWYCPDCEITTIPQQTIPALEHSYIDGTCEHCGTEKPAGMEPAAQLVPGQYVIVAHTEENGSFALPTTIADKMNGVKVTVDGELLMGTEDESVELPVWTIEACGEGVALTNGTKYLGWTSSTNFADSDTAYQWNVNGTKLIASTTATASTVRGLIFQEVDNNKKEQLRFGPYAISNTDGYVQELAFYKYEPAAEETPVVEMGGKEYTSFEEAYAEDPDTTIKLLAPIENINVTGDLYLDLNGFTASVDGANAIFAGDSSATTAKAGTGVLTTTANVETVETIGSTRYVALKGENNQYTFHALEMKLTAVSLRTSAAGVYYKAEMICDAELKAATACHGVVVSVDGMPGADFATVTDKINAWTAIEGAPAEGNMTSCSVFGIFKDGKENNAERGEMKIYARAYLQLKDTNEIVMSSNSAAKSLKDVMEEVNGKFATLEDADQKNLINFFKKWESAMVNWNVGNIADAADAAN